MTEEPAQHEAVDEVYRENIQRLIKRGSWTAPAHIFEGARFQASSEDPEGESWENLKKLWLPWTEK